MARVLILGGGFGGVVAAEILARQLDDEHEITLVSRSRKFVFYPSLVRLAFGNCEPDDVSFDLRESMLNRRVRFVHSEVARVEPHAKKIVLARGDFEGVLDYDFLVFALGRRLATERIPGFFEHANHILSVEGALKFGEALRNFRSGRAVIGQCLGARLPVPVYESAFALADMLGNRRGDVKITIISPEPPGLAFDDAGAAVAVRTALDARGVDVLSDFPVTKVTAGAAFSENGRSINFNLLMLLPPFEGSSAASRVGITDNENYINVDSTMRVTGVNGMYAVGDCVNFNGPKLGHMAVQQAEVAATNLIAEISGATPKATYNHELMLVIEGGPESIYLHKDLWGDEGATVRQGRFWSWAKRVHEKYWTAKHS
jgi:sulfide:quinone oxidoreductase